jgi:CheY-like chemotaxis protein
VFGLRFGWNLCLLELMGRRILCVEDDKDWRYVLEQTLTDAGYEALVVSDATETWERAELFEPELVIIDLDLAGENGLMLMNFVKQNAPDARIMLYTGTDQDAELIMYALANGAHAYVRKGSPQDLLREVETILQQG